MNDKEFGSFTVAEAYVQRGTDIQVVYQTDLYLS